MKSLGNSSSNGDFFGYDFIDYVCVNTLNTLGTKSGSLLRSTLVGMSVPLETNIHDDLAQYLKHLENRL